MIINGSDLKQQLDKYLLTYLESSKLDNQMKDLIIKLLHKRGKVFHPKSGFIWSEFYLLYSLAFLDTKGLEKKYLSIAIAIEFLILATDLIDDISDNEIKGENLSLLSIPQALTVGNALLIEAFSILLTSNSNLNFVFDELRHAAIGQWQDISFVISKKEIPTEKDYFNLINKKSSSLVRLLFRLNDYSNEDLILAATNIGLAGQLKNDAQDIFASEKNDLFHFKATLPLIKALEYSIQHENGELKKKLVALKETKSTEVLYDIQNHIKNVGAIDYTLVLSNIHMNNAITLIKNYRNSSNSKEIDYLINYLTG